MLRIHDGAVRDNWPGIIQDQGLVYWPTELPDGSTRSYWREGQYYSFTSDEIAQIDADAREIFAMLVEAGDYIVDHPALMVRMGIPEYTHKQVRESWNRQNLGEDWGSVYGRYDVVYGRGSGYDDVYPELGRIRLYEFNADTPTSLLESAICQWYYYTDTGQGSDQWNEIWERLIEAWKRNLGHAEQVLGFKPKVHFVCSNEDSSGEDVKNLECLQHTCQAAGYETKALYIQNLFYDERDGRFYEYEGGPHLDVVFKLYPWEMMVREEWGPPAFQDMERIGEQPSVGAVNADTYTGGTLWIEPPYKMLWSNKSILAVLWKLFGNDPERSQLLIPAYFIDERPEGMTNYVVKPIFGREGASVTVVENGKTVLQTEGSYGTEGFICQEYVPPPNYPGLNRDGGTEDNHPVLGIWMIDGEPGGLGIRESEGVITDDLSYFVPHVIANPDREVLEHVR